MYIAATTLERDKDDQARLASSTNSGLLLLLLELKIPVQLGLDVDDPIEKLLDDLVAVRLEGLVELFEPLFGLLVYGGLRAAGGALVLL